MGSYFTTSQAAKLLSVSSDTVLKWVRAGKIPSYRTPGGHSRIPADAVQALLPEHVSSDSPVAEADSKPTYHYCWEFYSDTDGVRQECHNCIAYKSQAHRCYEMRSIPEEFGHLKLFCQTGCEDCDFYQVAHTQELSVLVVSRNQGWLDRLEAEARQSDLRVEFASGEYECASLLHDFRPDFIVLDCSLGKARARDLCRHLARDDRIPLARIILASRQARWAEQCKQEVFGWIEKPFTIQQLDEFMAGMTGVPA